MLRSIETASEIMQCTNVRAYSSVFYVTLCILLGSDGCFSHNQASYTYHTLYLLEACHGYAVKLLKDIEIAFCIGAKCKSECMESYLLHVIDHVIFLGEPRSVGFFFKEFNTFFSLFWSFLASLISY